MASFYGKKELVAYLNANGAKLDVQSKEGEELTEAAIASGKTENFDTLIEAGANVNTKDKNGKTMLIATVEKSNTAQASELIKKGANVNVKYTYGENKNFTPLMTAVIKKDLPTTKLLLENGANINEKEDLTGATALQIAILSGNEDIVATLLFNGADLNVSNKLGFTAADLALAKKDGSLLKKLTSHGALFGKKTGGILAPYGCTITYNQEKDLYSIKPQEALNALKKFEESENPEYDEYMEKSNTFRTERGFVLDKHAYKIYKLLFESI